VSGHGFEVTGDPADLPPGAKIIEINLTPSVQVAARAIHDRMAEGSVIIPEDWDAMSPEDRYPFMELGHAAIMALVEHGWHDNAMHDAVAAAAADMENDNPHTGMDPR
jgi:hypothetical protein